MNKKDIKQLAQFSFTKENLDEKKVLRIAKLLDKRDLRQYIKELKLKINKNTIKVSVSSKLDKETENSLKTIFKNKKMEIIEDKDLIAGIKIEDFDNIYELNLKNTLDLMINYIKQ